MTWVVTELQNAVHVHPFYEEGHILGTWCWCCPEHDDEYERPKITHRDQLERTVAT